MQIARRGLLVLASATTMGWIGTPLKAAETDYPKGTIEVTVPFTAGGGVDVMGRVAAELLSHNLDRTFIVVNRPGAGSNTGNQFVARAKPDGMSLLVSSVGLAANKALYKHLSYDPLTSFTPISLISNAPVGLFINKSVPARTLQEMVAYLKANPGKLNYASYGIGSSPHLAAELFQHVTGTKMVHVPFTGNGPAVLATIQDSTQVIFSSTVAAGPFVKDGSLIPIAYAAEKRSDLFPEMPTFKELGVDFEMGTWFGLLGPADLPQPMVKALYTALKKGIDSPQAQKIFSSQGAEPVGSTPEAFTRFLHAETARMTQIITNAGITAN